MTLCVLTKIAATEASNNLPLVLIHGWGNHSAIWQPLLSDLPADRDYFSVDLPAFGKAVAQECTWSEVVSDLMSQLPRAYLLLGWSLGGMLAVQLAQQSSHVKGLLTLASNGSFVEKPHWPTAMAEHTFNQFCANFACNPAAAWQGFINLQLAGEATPKALLKQLKPLLPFAPQFNDWAPALNWLAQIDNTLILSQLRQPQLHLLGDRDALIPAASAQHINHCQIIANAGHLLPLTQIASIKAAIRTLDSTINPRPDKRRIARSFSRAAEHYDGAAHLQQTVGLQLLRHLPANGPQDLIVDLGCGTGFLSRQLPQHKLVALDIATGMLQTAQAHLGSNAFFIQADAENLPLAANSHSGVLANLSLQWCALDRVFAEVERILLPGGWCLFSTLGPHSLHELKAAWRTIDQHTHVNHFLSRDAVMSALAYCGLRQAQCIVREHRVQAPTLRLLLNDLKAIGARNLNAGQAPGLMTPQQWLRLQSAYEGYRNAQGCLEATYQVFYIVAQKVDREVSNNTQ